VISSRSTFGKGETLKSNKQTKEKSELPDRSSIEPAARFIYLN